MVCKRVFPSTLKILREGMDCACSARGRRTSGQAGGRQPTLHSMAESQCLLKLGSDGVSLLMGSGWQTKQAAWRHRAASAATIRSLIDVLLDLEQAAARSGAPITDPANRHVQPPKLSAAGALGGEDRHF